MVPSLATIASANVAAPTCCACSMARSRLLIERDPLPRAALLLPPPGVTVALPCLIALSNLPKRDNLTAAFAARPPGRIN